MKVAFSFLVAPVFQIKGKSAFVIPSRESFHPVVLRPGELMRLEPEFLPIERAVSKGLPIHVSFSTKGFLVDRMGFTDVNVERAVIYRTSRSSDSIEP